MNILRLSFFAYLGALLSASLRSLRSDRDTQSDPRVPNGDAAETAER